MRYPAAVLDNINCRDAASERLPLCVYDDGREWYEADLDLCDRCGSEFLALDWVEEQSGTARDD